MRTLILTALVLAGAYSYADQYKIRAFRTDGKPISLGLIAIGMSIESENVKDAIDIFCAAHNDIKKQLDQDKKNEIKKITKDET